MSHNIHYNQHTLRHTYAHIRITHTHIKSHTHTHTHTNQNHTHTHTHQNDTHTSKWNTHTHTKLQLWHGFPHRVQSNLISWPPPSSQSLFILNTHCTMSEAPPTSRPLTTQGHIFPLLKKTQQVFERTRTPTTCELLSRRDIVLSILLQQRRGKLHQSVVDAEK